MLQAPLDLNAALGCADCGGSCGLGDASGGGQKCGILIPAIAGAVAFWLIPPLLTGFFGGMRDEVSDYRNKRGVYANRR